MDILLNPVVISVIVMLALCLCKLNVYLSIILASLLCGVLGGSTLSEAVSAFIAGMGNNCSNVFSLVLFGVLAEGMKVAGIGDVLAPRLAKVMGKNTWLLCVLLCAFAVVTETFILIYVAFVPIIVPSLLETFNRCKIDRRLLVTVIVIGLQIGYVCVPYGYGLMFQQVVQSSMADNGVLIELGDIIKGNVVVLISMFVAFAMAMILYGKKREYHTSDEVALAAKDAENAELPKMEWKHWATLISALVAIVVQTVTSSMPLGALAALFVLVLTGGVKLRDFEKVSMDGIVGMGFVSLVLLSATGFASVSSAYGNIDGLVTAFVELVGGSKIIASFAMLFLGLIVTMGIGTSWGTIPIVATLIVPIGAQLGFSPMSIAMLVSAAACLGDAGSPASDQTLIPTAAFNIDGQHDHIRDTCVPTFICCNIPMLVVCAIGALFI